MFRTCQIRMTILFVALALAVSAAPAARAQDAQPMSEKDAKKQLKKGAQALEKAREASARGNASAAAEHATGLSVALESINRQLAERGVKEKDALDIAARMDEATLKHIPALEGLLARAPEQARPAIEHALQASRRGHDAATAAILDRSGAELEGGVLTSRAAQATMKRNDALLRHAERARRHGDQATVQRSVEQFTNNLEVVNRSVATGAVDPSQAASVLDRVDSSTGRHLGTLEDLLGQVPEQARPAIERAIAASQRGRIAAREALSRTPGAGIQGGQAGATGRSSGVGGRPDGVGSGPPSNRPGPAGNRPGGPPR